MRTEVIIVGSGLVGAALAVALGRAGLRVALIDRDDPRDKTTPGSDGRAIALSHGSQCILEGLGMWEHIAPHAEPIWHIRVQDGHSSPQIHYDAREVGASPFGYIVHNPYLLKGVLRTLDATPNITQCVPARIAELTSDAFAARVRLEQGEEWVAPLLIGADGKRSFVRESFGIKARMVDYDQTAIVLPIRHSMPHQGLALERFLPSGPFAVLPFPGDRSSLVWTEKTEDAPAYMALDDKAIEAEIRTRLGEGWGEIAVDGPRFSYPLSLMVAKAYGGERMVLAGDAAHHIHPIAGQGLNVGYRDVAVLAELILDQARLGLDIGAPDLLRRYARARQIDVTSMMAMTDGLNRLFSNGFAPLRLARRAGLGGVEQLRPLKRFFMRHAMGLTGPRPRLLRGETL